MQHEGFLQSTVQCMYHRQENPEQESESSNGRAHALDTMAGWEDNHSYRMTESFYSFSFPQPRGGCVCDWPLCREDVLPRGSCLPHGLAWHETPLQYCMYELKYVLPYFYCTMLGTVICYFDGEYDLLMHNVCTVLCTFNLADSLILKYVVLCRMRHSQAWRLV